MTFLISARRSNGESVYYLNDATQGERMVPYAQSIAYQFDDKPHAKRVMAWIAQNYKGLNNWTVEDSI